ncbi:MAG: 2-oxoisovalerate dehydrogenase component [Clostridiales bacterium]|jgi:2-oxoisovalerate dehydrogenase E1 component|nr:2-oxoisovalerate dehydrogenase component [Clostridiales bacterium]
MAKQLPVKPEDVRSASWIEFEKIPVNQYQKKPSEETKKFSKDDMLRIYRDMRMIREFENMLYSIKTTNSYNGLEYNNPGPAHLSIGQEAAAVGQAYNLDKNDFIFGSHRSHGEIIAKSLSAIQKLSDQELLDIMEGFLDGVIWKIVEKNNAGKDRSVKEMAIDFLIYGTLAEIFAKNTGFHKGLGGSMHAFFLPFGVYPNNAIVGGSADISVGAALYKKINSKPGIVVCNIGDGSMGCGPVWEGFMMAAMDQFNTLWEGDMKGGLPLIFNIMNNQYAMGGQTRGETMGYEYVARIGAGVNPDQMHAERVDGYNPMAVIDAMDRKMNILREKRGPVLMDTVTYRYAGHSPSDADSYRTTEEKEMWERQDSIQAYRSDLVMAGVASESDFEAIDEFVVNTVTAAVGLAINPEISPRMDLNAVPDAIEKIMFSNQKVAKMEDRPADMLQSKEDNFRVQQIARKTRFAFDEKGKPVSKNKVYQLRDGLFEAIIDKFYEDPTLVAYGEENRDWGGAFAVYRGLTEAVPYHRLFNSPISEGAIVGSAVGYAMSGGRALVELMYCDFLGRAGDEVFNQLPKWQAMSAGILKMPVVVRVSVGSKYGAQHSQDWTSLCAQIPGLKVVFPVTPYDAKGLMTSALNGTDPVLFFESQRIYDIGEQFHEGGVPAESYEVEIGEPDVKRAGSDLTILTIGATLYRALDAAKIFEEQYGISAEVIDARTMVPFNYEKVVESVKKTGKIIVAGDACDRGSYLSDLARNINDLCFDDLDAPAVVLGSRNWITPAFELEDHFFPQADWFIDVYHEKIQPIDGYVAKRSFNDVEIMRRNRLGV